MLSDEQNLLVLSYKEKDLLHTQDKFTLLAQ